MAKATTKDDGKPSKATAKQEGEGKATPKAKAGAAKIKADGSRTDGKRTDGIHKPVQPSAELAAVVGSDAQPRSEIISKLWDYIRKNDLQNPKDKREILADDNLKKVFGKDKVTMFEMNKHVSAHVS